MREKDVERYLYREAKRRGAMPMKFVSPGLNGVPDRCILFHGGLIVFVEVKAPGEKPRKQQLHRISQMRDRGALVRVVDTKAGVDRLMEEVEVLRENQIKGGDAL